MVCPYFMCHKELKYHKYDKFMFKIDLKFSRTEGLGRIFIHEKIIINIIIFIYQIHNN